ncbi:MAG: winged helix-turn-helix domain-containing protein [Candidatus Korobacteraceae bacterium]
MDMPVTNPDLIDFGVYRLDVKKGELRKLGTSIRLQPQPLKLLVLLASSPGEVVTREQIQQEIWGTDTFVDCERGMNHCVRQVRAALSDDANSPRYIETVPRRGYRFIAPVQVPELPSQVQQASAAGAMEAQAPDSTPRPERNWVLVALAAMAVFAIAALIFAARHSQVRKKPAKTPSKLTLAVLPFENLTGDQGQEYLSDGITEEMIVHLSTVSPRQLGVIARTSAMTYKHSGKVLKQIGTELGAPYLLEGTVRRFGSKLRITARLLRAADESQLWTGSYEGEGDEERILSFEESAASQVALSLSVILPGSHLAEAGTTNRLAYEAYLRGRYQLNQRNENGFRKATEYFQNAIALDPNYAQAYAGLADCYNLTIEYYERRSGDELPELARSAASKAIKLNPQLSESYSALAFNQWRYQWKFNDADAGFQKALQLNPNNANALHWYGLFLASRGRFDEARQELRQARVLDPLSLITITNVGWVSYLARDFDGAIANYQEALTLDPNFQTALMKLAWAYEEKHMWREAMETRQRFYLAAGQPGIARSLAGAYANSGYPGVLHTIITETQKPDASRYYDDYQVAKLYASIDDRDRAFTLLQRACDHRSGWMVFLAVEPAFDRLHTDPRFARLISEAVSSPR